MKIPLRKPKINIHERRIIKSLLDGGCKINKIATFLNRDQSNVSREIAHFGKDKYDPELAQIRADEATVYYRKKKIIKDNIYTSTNEIVTNISGNNNTEMKDCDFIKLENKVDGLELQIKLLYELIEENKNDNIHKRLYDIQKVQGQSRFK